MNQQELMPEPQSSQESYMQSQDRQSSSSTKINAQIYSHTRRSKISDRPKSDHPATFEGSLPPYSYPAQDQPSLKQQQPIFEQSSQWQQQTQTQTTRTARDTYQPYSQYNAPQQVPWWTQPQDNSTDISKWIGLVLLALVVLVSIPALCSIGTVFISVVFVFSLLPVVLALAPIVFFLLIPLIKVLGPENQDNRSRRRQYDQSWW